MEAIAETQTLTERAVGELTEFNEMIAIVIPYGEFTVANNGISQVKEAHIAVKKLHKTIEDKREQLKSGALEYGRAVDSIAGQLKAKVKEVESKLKAERDAFDAIEKAEKLAKEAEKAAKKQGRVNDMVAAGIALDWAAVELSDEEWMWWFSKSKKTAEELAARIEAERIEAEAFAAAQRKERDELAAKMQAGIQAAAAQVRKLGSRIARMEALGVVIDCEHQVAQLSDEQFEFDYSVAKKAIEDRRAAEEIESQRQAEELRIRAEEMEQQRIADAATMAAERRQLESEREELRRQQAEIHRAEAEEDEAKRAEELKRREDAAKPELERLEAAINKIRACCKDEFFLMPWWAPEFVVQFESFAAEMKSFVRGGEGL